MPMFLYSIQYRYLGESLELNVPLELENCVDIAHQLYIMNEAEIDHICVVDNATGEVMFHIDVEEVVEVSIKRNVDIYNPYCK